MKRNKNFVNLIEDLKNEPVLRDIVELVEAVHEAVWVGDRKEAIDQLVKQVEKLYD